MVWKILWLYSLLAACTVTGAQLDCNFDKDLCQWTQVNEGELNWTRNRGTTSSFSTGPTSDHTTGGGYYIYMEASVPARDQDRAQLISPVINSHVHQTCFLFWYHMYGSTMGTLTVYTIEDGRNRSIWTRQGNQGDQWLEAEVPISAPHVSNIQVVLEARKGPEVWSDIAVDDVVFTNQPCTRLETSTTDSLMTSAATPPASLAASTTSPVTLTETSTTDSPITSPATPTASLATPTTSPATLTESHTLEFITVGGEEYIRLSKPCNLLEHLCPVSCYMQSKKLEGGFNCIHCYCSALVG